MSKTSDRITQVRLTADCSCVRTGFVCGFYMPPDMAWVPCGRRVFDVAWIDSRFAKVGKRLTVEGSDSVWTVDEVYGTREVADLDMQYKVWREFSTKLGG